MAFSKLLKMASVALVVLLDLTSKTDACRCQQLTVCEGFASSDVVLKLTTLSRLPEGEVTQPVTYTAKVDTVYKGDPALEEISFTTAGNTGACGLPLQVEEEYLLGLSGGEDTFTGSSCGLWKEWSFVADEDAASLEAGCP